MLTIQKLCAPNYLACMSFALAMTAATPSGAQNNDQAATDNPVELTIDVAEASRKINIAGRQRMLSQRMAKAACLMANDISFATAYDQLTQALSLFERSDVALRKGDEELELSEETLEPVLDALSAIDAPWASYQAIINDGVTTGEIGTEALADLDDASLSVLKFMNIAVFKSARAYAQAFEDVPLGLAITIDVAGRQRMLTQKAVKEACMMATADDPDLHADRLAETVDLFDLSLDALRDGYEDVGVIAAPSREIDRKLSDVADLWEPVKAILDRAAEGEILSMRELSQAARLSEPLMRTMDEAVGMYGN